MDAVVEQVGIQLAQMLVHLLLQRFRVGVIDRGGWLVVLNRFVHQGSFVGYFLFVSQVPQQVWMVFVLIS